ncbi:MAG: Tex family protein [Clostridia bacterium]
MNIYKQIAEELKISEKNIKSTISLLNEGNTVPFIARYRKEVTNNLTDEQIYSIKDKYEYLLKFNERKASIRETIEEKGKLTNEIEKNLDEAITLQDLEDIYLPFKSTRKTLADTAKENGLEPLATIIWDQATNENLNDLAENYLNENTLEVDDALEGAKHIITSWINEDINIRKIVRSLTLSYGYIETKALKDNLDQYEQYEKYSQTVSTIPPHRVLAINRAESEEYLSINVIAPEKDILVRMKRDLIKNNFINSDVKEFLVDSVETAYKKYIKPSIERDVRRHLTEQAENKAIDNFKDNLYNLLMQPPISDLNIMGIDPAYRTGCKVVIINKTGSVLETYTIYPHQPQVEIESAKKRLKESIKKHDIKLITIGNGTASRETETLVAEILSNFENVSYLIVDEAGASVYSASKIARKEFPDLNVSMRGAVSIARRVLDPLAELVKIDPKSIGVGMYQHDVNQNSLENALEQIVVSCVNSVGVDLNTASSSLLRYISGISSSVANNIIDFRESKGSFTNRSELLEVSRIGEKTYEQCAGFLRIRESNEFLDNTRIHPESYDLTYNILDKLGISRDEVNEEKSWQDKIDFNEIKSISKELNAGIHTVKDIISELKRPGHDPRENMPKPVFSRQITTFEDLYEGLILQGVVRNVIDFGAFVDVGVKQDGLIHISEISSNYIKHPGEVLSIGDQIEVKIIKLDKEKGRISLSLKF